MCTPTKMGIPTMSTIQTTKPHLDVPVRYKLDCTKSVNQYLFEHGWEFSDKTERDNLIIKFLAIHDMPIHLHNQNYKGAITHCVLNSYEASRNWKLLKKWLYQQKKAENKMKYIEKTLANRV